DVTSQGVEVPDLSCSVSPAAVRRGTTVRVTSPLIDPDTVRLYLRDALHFFPTARAIVRLDGIVLNDGALVAGGRLYEDAATPGATAPAGRFHLGGRSMAPGILAATYHAGVKVESCLAVPELVLIDFPSVVELTEGRDALKLGPAFASVALAFYKRL